MSKSSQAANAVLKAVEDVCALYRIPVFRMQSRVFTVIGAKGKKRPMFVGRWKDVQGQMFTSGMADLLLAPRIPCSAHFYGTVFLWVEAKAGKGELTTDQEAFKTFVESQGMYFLECHDSADQLLEWLKAHGVTR